jgi:hypothetical protein
VTKSQIKKSRGTILLLKYIPPDNLYSRAKIKSVAALAEKSSSQVLKEPWDSYKKNIFTFSFAHG